MKWHEILPNIFTWYWFSEEKGYNFNGYYFVTDDGSFVIDPVLATDEVWRAIDNKGSPQAVYLTNKDHTRKSMDFKDRYGCEIWIHEADKESADITIDKTFRAGQNLPGGFEVITLDNMKSPGESALQLDTGEGVMIIGDALIGNPPGTVSLLPPAKVPHQDLAKKSLDTLLDYRFDALLLGDGVSFTKDGRQALEVFLRS
jgi:glyoxylase-like metal-dependent hydrolase (beta-lactamase superfamily II)